MKIKILVSILILSAISGGSFGVIKFINYKNNISGEDQQIEDLIKTQQDAINNLQSQLEDNKKVIENTQSELSSAKDQVNQVKDSNQSATKESNQKISDLQQKLNAQKSNTDDLTITASEIAPYLNGVVKLSCGNISGSGSLWDIKQARLYPSDFKFADSGYLVLTNNHVVKDASNCLVSSPDRSDNYLDLAQIERSDSLIDKNKDSAFLEFRSADSIFSGDANYLRPLEKFNYSISSMKFCDVNIPVGSPVIIIGYPAFGVRSFNFQGSSADSSVQLTTDGIISGYDALASDKHFGSLPYQNYFVSAKIDSGNSGGIALSKDNNGLCLLGMPTWLNIGNYENQGMIQSIHNIFDGLKSQGVYMPVSKRKSSN